MVTANARAARALRLAHAEQQRARGIQIWPTPAIFDWESWLTALWQEMALQTPSAPLVLTRLQEQTLWKQMEREDARLVVSPDSMATLAAEAWSLLSQYESHAARNYPWPHTDAEHFRLWAAAFDAECGKYGWVSRSQLESLLSKAGSAPIPAEVLLVGFDRITPAQKTFLRACEERSTIIGYLQAPSDISTPRLIAGDDLRDEISACAWWCRDRLTRRAEDRIGVLVPGLDSVRAEIDRIFRQVLMPESENIAAPFEMPYEFSLGIPLADVPVVKAALLLLGWISSSLLEEEVTWLTLSGFFAASDAEELALAHFDSRMRDAGALSPELPLTGFFSKLNAATGGHLSSVRDRIRGVLRTAEKNNVTTQSRSWSQWVEIGQAMLNAAGWPGHSSADSVQFQAEKRWLHLLDQIALLDFDGSRVSYSDFLSTLQAQAAETIFSAESRHAPIQIQGAMESSGQQFDAVWFMGADDQQWPGNPRPHPLLPLAVQQKAQMPHATRDLDWQLSEKITRRIAASAPVCVFSYARTDKAAEQRPSPLLAGLFPAISETKASELRAEISAPLEMHPEPALESVTDDSGRISWPMSAIAGGSEVLKQQAACPFQAFASVRLRARPLKRTESGFSAAERGSLLHKILQNLWSGDTPEDLRLRTLSDLNEAIAAGRLETILTHHISAALASYRKQEDHAWTRAYLDAEQQRLAARLREWLNCEAPRQPFTVVAVEQELNNIGIGDLKLNLRADRIDRLPDGGHLLIDYKTGHMATRIWEGERPDEPQLPLYAIYGGVEDVRGLLFAQVRAGEMKFAGHVANARELFRGDLAGTDPLVKAPYDDSMRDQWAAALLNVAEDFLRGEAVVDPKHARKTCQYCPFPGLCRVAELQRVSTADEAEEPCDE